MMNDGEQISMFNEPKETVFTRFEDSLYNDTIGEAWQYKMRKEYAEIESENPYWGGYDLRLSVSKVEEITYTEAKRVIEKYEWLGCMPVCVRHCYGLFFPHKDGSSWLLGGVTVFAQEYAENLGVWDKYDWTGKTLKLEKKP